MCFMVAKLAEALAFLMRLSSLRTTVSMTRWQLFSPSVRPGESHMQDGLTVCAVANAGLSGGS